jgi:hypothetical protein
MVIRHCRLGVTVSNACLLLRLANLLLLPEPQQEQEQVHAQDRAQIESVARSKSAINRAMHPVLHANQARPKSYA